MTASGILRIDQLLDGTNPAPIGQADDVVHAHDARTIGAIQDLLGGHGFRRMPLTKQEYYGRFGRATAQAIVDFQIQRGLPHASPTPVPPPPGTGKKKKRKKPVLDPATVQVDKSTLEKLLEPPVDEPAFKRKAAPRIARVYLTQSLQQTWGMMLQSVVLTSLYEGEGQFWFPNRGQFDHAGLSYGVLHWAQRPGRLKELLTDMRVCDQAAMEQIFGGAAKLSALLNFMQLPDYGLQAAPSNEPTDPHYRLTAEPWLGHFRRTCLREILQKRQVEKALVDYRANYALLRPAVDNGAGGFYLHSERAMTFFLDLANQFGVGSAASNRGAIGIFAHVLGAGPTDETSLLQRMADDSVRRMSDANKDGTETRRNFFLETELLRDDIDFTDP
jgi:hypothetical protein